MKIVSKRFPSGVKKIYYIQCEHCQKEIKRYGKHDFENKSRLCTYCFSKVKHKKEHFKQREKVCRICKQLLLIENFHKRKESGRYRTECTKCNNLKVFKLNRNLYEEKVELQQHKCLICKDIKKLVVDHCHTRGDIRGLLCDNCNKGLGCFKDNIVFLKNAISYLENHNESIL